RSQDLVRPQRCLIGDVRQDSILLEQLGIERDRLKTLCLRGIDARRWRDTAESRTAVQRIRRAEALMLLGGLANSLFDDADALRPRSRLEQETGGQVVHGRDAYRRSRN